MTRLRTLQTNFTAGEISAHLLGRGELRAYANGAARLRNVLIEPTGGVRRRPGLHHIDRLPGPARLIAFEFNTEQSYLLAVTDLALRVYRAGALVATVPVPWTAAQQGQLAWTQSADTLLVCHPEIEPRAITRRSDTDWTVGPWPIAAVEGVERWPFHRFAPASTSLTPSGTEGRITLTASAASFGQAHAGTLLRFRGKVLRILQVHGPALVTAAVLQALPDAEPSADWHELAWSAARGWPICATFHQDRLVVGGARDLPNRLWLSRAGDLFDFDTGTGLDDESIAFPILSDQVNAIRAVFSGRHLQVFTSGAEWMVKGEPLTPRTVQLQRQTRIGSPVDRTVPPRDIDGATLFVARGGRQVREFLYTDVEQAYRSTDLALLAQDLIDRPVDQDYDPGRRLLYLAMSDGRLATLTAYRSEQVTAWTLIETEGRIGAVAVAGGEVYVTVQRNAAWTVETFSDDVLLDAALTGTAEAPTVAWSGLDHLEGRTVRVVADGIDAGPHRVAGGTVVLRDPARSVAAGLAYRHVVEPLPPSLAPSSGGSQGLAMRPVESVFRLHETRAFVVDAGHGPVAVPLRMMAGSRHDRPPAAFSGDRRVRHLGWTRGGTAPLWRIEQDAPLPFTLLCVTTELKVND